MNKKVIIGIVALVVLAAGAYIAMNNKSVGTQQDAVTLQKNESSSQTGDAPKLAQQTVGKPADCSLYTFTDLGKIWGVTFVDTDINNVSELNSDGGKQYSCKYNETDSGKGLTVDIEFREHASVDAAKQAINDTRSGAKYGDTVYYALDDVASLGDEAFFSLPAKQVNNPKNVEEQLYVRKGSVVFLISATNLDGVDGTYRDKILSSYKLHFQ